GLGEAEEPAVGAHDPEVVRHCQHGTGTERVTVYGGHRGYRQGEHSCEQPVHVAHITLVLVTVGQHPLEVEAGGVELAGSDGDERCGTIVFADGVQYGVDGLQPLHGEAVLIVAEFEHEHGLLTVQCGHRTLLRSTWLCKTAAAVLPR